jgi:hypothetical protein
LVSPNWAEFNWILESTPFGSPWNRVTDFNWFPTGQIHSPPRIPKKNVGNLRILSAATMQSLVLDSVPSPTPPAATTDPRHHPQSSARAASPSTGDEEEPPSLTQSAATPISASPSPLGHSRRIHPSLSRSQACPSPPQPVHPEIWPSTRPHLSRAGTWAAVGVVVTCCQ